MSIELPQYRCHKVVRAGKIESILEEGERASLRIKSPTWTGSIVVDPSWVKKHNPRVGGYYVVYEDGYTSYSPAEAFEAGYTRVTS
jgi:hypothetical protein